MKCDHSAHELQNMSTSEQRDLSPVSDVSSPLDKLLFPADLAGGHLGHAGS